jgi:pimeloyl-ACP methyl ester carboxylesterase
MSAISASPTRRSFLATSAAASALSTLPGRLSAADDVISSQPSNRGRSPMAATDDTAIRPFRINVPQEALVDLRRRITATRWPEKETVADQSQGVQLATIQKLTRHWATEYDWRKAEARLNALPQFTTQIDGLDIHFIHVRSNNENALPIIVTHGWPGSIIEQLKIIDPLANPTAHGASASDAFHVVVPSMAGYGFSGKPTSTGWGPERMGRAWAELMKRLGYTRYVAQGGDWRAFVVDQMGLQAPAGLLAIHTNMPATVPADVDKALQAGGPAPSGLSAEERRAYEELVRTVQASRLRQIYGVTPANFVRHCRFTHRPSRLASRSQ